MTTREHLIEVGLRLMQEKGYQAAIAHFETCRCQQRATDISPKWEMPSHHLEG